MASRVNRAEPSPQPSPVVPGEGGERYNPPHVFELIQILYWLALSTWFGGVLFISIAAPVIMRSVREANPVLPGVLSVNLEGQHGTLLGGSIVGSIMNLLVRIELACAGVLLMTLAAHWAQLPRDGGALVMQLLRNALYLAAVGLLIYHWRVLWPRMWRKREEYIEHADEPDVANPALDELDRLQGENATVLVILLGVLLAMILFSANIYQVYMPQGGAG